MGGVGGVELGELRERDEDRRVKQEGEGLSGWGGCGLEWGGRCEEFGAGRADSSDWAGECGRGGWKVSRVTVCTHIFSQIE